MLRKNVLKTLNHDDRIDNGPVDVTNNLVRRAPMDTNRKVIKPEIEETPRRPIKPFLHSR